MRRGKALSSITVTLLSIVLVVLWPRPAAASITAIGDIDPAYNGTDDPWILATNLMIGRTADASLVVSGGSQVLPLSDVTDGGVGLAWDSGVTASLTVTGPGSLLRNSGLTLGFLGNANLLVADGATVSGGGAILAENAGSTALATITGTGSLWENRGSLTIGRSGDGTVVVADGGMLTSDGAYVGFNAGSIGRVTVTGPNSVWENRHGVEGGDINIGWFGDGSVTVADGARVTTIDTGTELALWQPGASGTLTVTGPNSLWETRVVTIGGRGNATVNILDGGTLVSSDAVFSAGNYGSTATINVSGPGSLLEVYDYLGVALEGRADMVISNGGRVHNVWSRVAEEEPSIGTVTVTGPNSVWDMRDSLFLGDRGDANMVVANGGRVIDNTAHMAAEAGSVASALVTGSGSRWENSGPLFLGEFGTGTVTVADGGALITTGVIAGVEAGGVGTLLATGPDTTLQGAPVHPGGIPENPPDANTYLSLEAIIGDRGTGTVTIADGARVTTEEGMVYVGYWPEAVGHLVVTGPNSVWEDAGTVHVGHFGAGTLSISDGGAVIGTNDAYIGTSYWPLPGNPTSSQGSVTVADPGSLWRVGGTLMVGDIGQAQLVVSAGGRVESKWGYVNDLALVTGAGSLWQNERTLTVEDWLKIEAGGQVTDANAYVGFAEDGNALVHVTGAGSRWDTSGELQVGRVGTTVGVASTVYIEDGAHVTSRTGVLGVEPTGAALVTVTGPGTVWENLADPNTGRGGDLYVGRSGQGVLGIGSGGRVISQTGSLGHDATGEGEVVVAGAGSLWENNTTMEVGRAGTGRLWVSNGGTVTTQEAAVAVEAGSEGQIIVEGPGSELEVEWGMILGARGNAGMSIRDSGQVRTMLATIGAEAGSTGAVSVSGDAWWVVDSATWGNRGQADVVISDGGHVYSELTWMGMEAEGTADVLVTGPGASLTGSACYVGGFGQSRLTVADGGLVGNLDAGVGLGTGGLGEVFVTGPDSLWEVEFNLTVAQDGAGWLTVSDGAHVTTRHAFIGTGPDGVGSVIVNGPNSVLQPSHVLYVGGNEAGPQGTGYLGIYSGGLVDANDVTIWSTGTVMGDGMLRANLVRDYGTISPGASIGTLTVEGDLSVNDGVLEIEIDNEGNSDKLLVTGHVGFGGSVEPIPVETIVGTHQYVVVEANSLSVELSGWIDPPFPSPEPIPGLLRTSVKRGSGEDVNSLLLYVTALPFDEPNIVQTDNQRALGAALQELAGQDANEVTLALQQLSTADEVRQAYNQLSGQTIPALAPVSVADTTKYMGMISSRLRSSAGAFSNSVGLPLDSAGTGPDGMGGADTLGVDAGRYGFAAGNGTPHMSDEPWAVWSKGYGLFGDRESEGGVPGYDYHVYGVTFGLDYQFTQRLLLGFTGGYSDGDISHSSSRDRADVDSTHAGLYGRYDTPWWYLDAMGTYADLNYETRRFVDLLGEQLEGEPSGSLVSGYVEVGAYRWLSERCLVQPLAAFQISSLHLDSFTESGGASALHFDDEQYDSYRGSLGVKVTQELFRHDDGCRASAELRGRWVHEFGDTRASLDAEFASSPGVVFRVSDSEVARDSAVLGAGLDTWFSESLRAFADYATELNPDNTIQLVSAGLEYRW